MNTALQLLTDLSVDPFHLHDYMSDPDRSAAAAGGHLEDLLRSAAIAGAAGAWQRSALCLDPGYDPLPDPDEPSPEA